LKVKKTIRPCLSLTRSPHHHQVREKRSTPRQFVASLFTHSFSRLLFVICLSLLSKLEEGGAAREAKQSKAAKQSRVLPCQFDGWTAHKGTCGSTLGEEGVAEAIVKRVVGRREEGKGGTKGKKG